MNLDSLFFLSDFSKSGWDACLNHFRMKEDLGGGRIRGGELVRDLRCLLCHEVQEYEEFVMDCFGCIF